MWNLKMLLQLLTCRLKGHISRTNNFDEECKNRNFIVIEVSHNCQKMPQSLTRPVYNLRGRSFEIYIKLNIIICTSFFFVTNKWLKKEEITT